MSLAEFPVFHAVANDVIGDDQNSMSNRHRRLLHSLAPRESKEQRVQEIAFGMPNGPCILNQHPAEIPIPFASSTFFALAGTFLVARTKSCPTGQMIRGRKLRHVHSDLADDGPCRGL